LAQERPANPVEQISIGVSGVELLKKIQTARMTLTAIMATGGLPTWQFAVRPCLEAVTMLRNSYTFGKLLGSVKSILPPQSIFRAEMEPLPLWKLQSTTVSLRL
jgi:hypothetical protein